MKGCRIFERFGFNLPKTKKVSKATLLSEYEEWVYDPKQFDWIAVNIETGFSGYLPPSELLNLLDYNIDTSIA